MTTPPTFKKFTSIENHNREGYVDRLRLHGHADGEWVVQEKAHGANLSFLSRDGEHWVSAKRTAALAPDEPFYNHHLLLERHRAGLSALWRVLRKRYPAGDGQVNVFGEVLGGSYPGLETPPGHKRVQKGIFYAPDNRFYAFDIWVGGAGYLGVDEANALFEAHGLPHAKTRFRGTLTEALAQPNDFDSEIPLLYGLEPVHPNVAEGTILRPAEPRHEHTGSRVIIKHKNGVWSDNTRHHKVRLPPEPKVSAAGAELLATAMTYATPARAPAAASKLGEVTRKDFGRLVGEVGRDLYADFSAAHGEALAALEDADRKAVKKALGTEATALVRRYFIELAT